MSLYLASGHVTAKLLFVLAKICSVVQCPPEIIFTSIGGPLRFFSLIETYFIAYNLQKDWPQVIQLTHFFFFDLGVFILEKDNFIENMYIIK